MKSTTPWGTSAKIELKNTIKKLPRLYSGAFFIKKTSISGGLTVR